MPLSKSVPRISASFPGFRKEHHTPGKETARVSPELKTAKGRPWTTLALYGCGEKKSACAWTAIVASARLDLAQ